LGRRRIEGGRTKLTNSTTPSLPLVDTFKDFETSYYESQGACLSNSLNLGGIKWFWPRPLEGGLAQLELNSFSSVSLSALVLVVSVLPELELDIYTVLGVTSIALCSNQRF